MTRKMLRGFSLLVAPLLVMQFTSGTAFAKKKKKGAPAEDAQPAATDSGGGGGMTFSPEEVHQDEPGKAGKKKPMSFTPEAVAPTGPPGPPSKVLERALKLYDAEDYANASIEL